MGKQELVVQLAAALDQYVMVGHKYVMAGHKLNVIVVNARIQEEMLQHVDVTDMQLDQDGLIMQTVAQDRQIQQKLTVEQYIINNKKILKKHFKIFFINVIINNR
jgi:hypothetical protein